MKLGKLTFLISLICFFNIIVNANEFDFTKNHKIEIFEDSELLSEKKTFTYGGFLNGKMNAFAKVKDKNKFESLVVTIKLKATQHVGLVNAFVMPYFFKSSKAFFKERPENNLFLNNKNTNSLIVKTFDLNKYLNDNTEEVPEFRAPLKKLVKENKLELPKYVLRSDHLYFRSSGELFWVSYMYNYTHDNDVIHLDRNISKFHPNIIDNNEKYKIYMNKWKNLSLKRHEKFQKDFKIKRELDLDVNNINLNKDIKFYKDEFYLITLKDLLDEKKTKAEKEKDEFFSFKEKSEAEKKAKAEKEKKEKLEAEKKAKAEKEKNSSEENNNSNLDYTIKKIKELNEMYKSGILTEEEFNLLKKELLN